MAYTLKQITVRTTNTNEGIKKVDEIWQDITNGKLPILFDSDHAFQQNVSLVSKYSNYESDENGEYDLSIIGVCADFFHVLENKVNSGLYKKYDETDENGDMGLCAKKAWGKVWSDKKSGALVRTYTEDYECIVPAEYAKDGKVHCYLYIAVK